MNRTISVLDSEVHLIDPAYLKETLDEWVRKDDDVCRQMIVTGFHGLLQADKNKYYRKITRSADLWVPDGIAPVLMARLNGIKGVQRIPGMDVVKTFLELANERGYSSFFYGDTDETLARLRANVSQNYPGHRIAGTYSPPFRPLSEKEDRQVVDMINETHPSIVWVGLGMPKQDVWAYEHKTRLNAKAAIGVGAVFRFLAGTVDRCPGWIGDRGFEWLYRLLMEPKKLWRRDLIEGPQFLWRVFLEQIGLRNSHRRGNRLCERPSVQVRTCRSRDRHPANDDPASLPVCESTMEDTVPSRRAA